MTAYTAPGIPKLAPSYTNAKHIIKIVAAHFGTKSFFTEENIKRRNRKREVVLTRQISMMLIRKNTQLSLKCIGEIFGKDHTTVIHSLATINDQRETNPELEQQIIFINNQLNS